jgi:DNA-binding transcriptional ArsR family regulator
MSNYRIEEIRRFAEMFKALSNPNRLDIFLRLVSCCPPGSRCSSEAEARRFVGELGKELDITLSTVSHHIKELRQAGLIRVERRGKNIECWVDEQAVSELAELLAGRGASGHFQEEGRSGRSSVGEVRLPQE